MSSSPLRNRALGMVTRAASPSSARCSLAGSPPREWLTSSQTTSPRRDFSSTGILSGAAFFSTACLLQQSSPIPDTIAAQWDYKKNKLTTPKMLDAQSIRLAHWNCTSCGAAFRRRVRDHCASQGQCPSCHARTSMVASRTSPSKPRLTAAAAAAMPQYSKDPRVLSPMLAHRWEKYEPKIDKFEDLFVSPKLDGIRCVVALDQVTKRPYFMSRNGNTFESCDLVAEELAPAFERDPTLVLDGELYSHKYCRDFGTLVGAIKVQRANRSAEHEEVQQALQFQCFDVMYAKSVTPSTPFSLRLDLVERVLGRLKGERTAIVRQKLATKDEVADLHAKALKSQYEGVMIKLGSGAYEHGKRSTNLLKMKIFQDAEYLIVGVIEGQGRLEGQAGAIVCRDKKGVEFRANFAVTDDARTFGWNNKKALIGKYATVQFQELTPLGVPRFAVFKAIRGASASGKDFA